MSDTNSIEHDFASLQELIISKHKYDHSTAGLKQLNTFMEDIKSRGIIDGIEVDGQKGKYLLFAGDSWLRACRHIKLFKAPQFVMWEESAFFEMLEKLVTAGVKSNKKRVLTRKHITHI